MSAAIEVRAAMATDRDAIARAIVSDGSFRVDEIEVALALVDGALAGDPDFVLRVAEEGGAVIGYACFGPTPMTAATWDLYWIVVDARARGRGAGGALIDAMERELRARGARQVRIETGTGDAHVAARALYERRGYPRAACLADFYAAGDALVIYYKAL